MSYPTLEPGGSLLIAWQLRGRRVLLVGGGEVAAGRLVLLKNADAHVTVLCAPEGLGKEMKYRIEVEQVVDKYIPEPYSREEQLTCGENGEMYDMILTAIDDPEASREICAWSRARHIPVNVADVPPECDFYFGSVIRRGPLQVMVSTGGKGPRLARQIRQRLENAIPSYTGDAIERVGSLRSALRKIAPRPEQSAARMSWMTDVCETWTIDQLAELDDESIPLVLEGWHDRTVPAYSQVMQSKRNWHWPRMQNVASFLLGVTSTAAIIVALAHRTHR
ncbi:Bifunctional dehydrogenase and ferrochelatase [Malassezia psittaci]|uniref:precorrin-2 dehydrogenase n=1 Tax=Malassezia psittaci TaxID=1821823 RepID=A0AAF0JJD9_9BASI|nr:Bifunctional dehydrogenase and ferrochelatase [Malassezia psittaci]